MTGYTTIVVGTDGSESSFRAVHRAAEIASATGAELVIASAYRPDDVGTGEADDALKDESYLVHGTSPAEQNLRDARDRIGSLVPPDRVTLVTREGGPVEVLTAVVAEHGADLLVVGNRGLGTLTDRVLGSIPSDVARKATVDVLIVHTV